MNPNHVCGPIKLVRFEGNINNVLKVLYISFI